MSFFPAPNDSGADVAVHEARIFTNGTDPNGALILTAPGEAMVRARITVFARDNAATINRKGWHFDVILIGETFDEAAFVSDVSSGVFVEDGASAAWTCSVGLMGGSFFALTVESDIEVEWVAAWTLEQVDVGLDPA